MRLKSLEVVGFKSFVDRTIINFEEGINSIVGPNGCGKSNVVDAIRWVMGEQSAKHLRGRDMLDVIFNGSDKRPAMGMAQVFLTFDNSDGRAPAEYVQYQEIQVGRRLYRSGESEYFINKTPCRLKDIIDLFLGTGIGAKAYSIVEQGMIGSIVSAKPEDRRQLIEEASGISKFKSRKEAALRKLEATKANLLRLDDILSELTRQMNSLNRQAKKAQRYKVVSEELRSRELALVSHKYLRTKAELDTMESDAVRFKEIEAASSAELSSIEAKLSTFRLSLSEVERELDSIQQDRWAFQNKLKLTESEISHKIESANTNGSHIERAKNELSSLCEKLESLKVRLDESTSNLISADFEREEKALLVSNFEGVVDFGKKKKEEVGKLFSDLQTNVMDITTRLSQEQFKFEKLSERTVDVTSEMARIQSRLDQIDLEVKELSGVLSSSESDVTSIEELKLRLQEEKSQLENSLSEGKKVLASSEENLNALFAELQTKKSQLESLEDLKRNLEGYQEGVKAILKNRTAEQSVGGVIGTVGEFMTTQPKFETALGAVLGEKMQFVVVESQQHGASAVEYLKSGSCGRGTFVPMSVDQQQYEDPTPPQGEGVIGMLGSFVNFADEYKGVGNYLVGDVVLVEDLPKALNIWKNGTFGYTLATLDGEVIDPAGAISGGKGGNVAEQLLIQSRRIRELGEDIASFEKTAEAAQSDYNAMLARTQETQKRLDEIFTKSHGEELKLVFKAGELRSMKDNLSHLEEERDQLTMELASLSEEDLTVRKQIVESKSVCLQLENDKTDGEKKFEEAKALIEGEDADLTDAEQKLFEARISFAQAKERSLSANKESERLLVLKAETVLEILRRKSEIELGEQDIKKLFVEADDLRSDIAVLVDNLKNMENDERELKDKYTAMNADISQLEASVHDLRKKQSEILKNSHGVDIKLTEERGKLQYMIQNVSERYRVDLPTQAQNFAIEHIDIEAEEAHVSQLKEKLDDIGSVNLDAVTEYDEIKARNDLISTQHKDLTESVSALQKAIQKINRTSRERFARTFEAVNSQFENLFPRLFKGGRAKLIMTDEENVLESGIEIVAQPPGKKLQSVSLLSGGEKALTAIALIFSIFLIKPSPFCLLDEVDAPLDDVNVDRFNELIRSMVKYSQFILITHNKRTMELADLLYGVTMEESGVSKIVSVKLSGKDDEAEAA